MKVHVNDGSPPPADANYFLVAGNGIYLKKRMRWVDATVPVKKIDGLQPQKAEAKLLLPPIPAQVFAKAVSFFNRVYKVKETESALLLHHSESNGWDITVPEQEATGTHVSYDSSERIPGSLCVGTMHSHCSMSAFHSGTDVGDEASQDGVHITIGLLHRFPSFGMDAEIVVNGNRFPLALEHLTGVSKCSLEDEKEEEPEDVVEPKEQPLRYWLQSFGKRNDCLYTVPFDSLHDWEVPAEWVDRVRKIEWPILKAFQQEGQLNKGLPLMSPIPMDIGHDRFEDVR